VQPPRIGFAAPPVATIQSGRARAAIYRLLLALRSDRLLFSRFPVESGVLRCRSSHLDDVTPGPALLVLTFAPL
jgi:hypothetical protein